MKIGRLRFYFPDKKVTHGVYSQSEKDVYVRYNITDFESALKDQYLSTDKNMTGLIGTRIRWRRWALVLDCDSTEALYRATEDLHLRKIAYRIWVSSPPPAMRFWVITDYVSSVRKCIKLMGQIPGVDPDYLGVCQHYKKIALRAFPKEGHRPRLLRETILYDEEEIDSWGKMRDTFGDGLERWWSSEIISWIMRKQRKVIEEAKRQQAIQKAKEAEELRIVLEKERIEKAKRGVRRVMQLERN